MAPPDTITWSTTDRLVANAEEEDKNNEALVFKLGTVLLPELIVLLYSIVMVGILAPGDMPLTIYQVTSTFLLFRALYFILYWNLKSAFAAGTPLAVCLRENGDSFVEQVRFAELCACC